MEELQKQVSDPVHKRLILAYRGSNPVQSMESELKKMLSDVLRHED